MSWEVSLAPLYLWATAVDGDLSAGPVTVPVSLSFSDAADHFDAAFSFHFEASRGRWGVLTDLDFIRLSSSSTFTLAGRTIEGEFEIDNILFDLAGTFLVNDNARFRVIGGLRTYTLSPELEFSGPNASVTPIDASATSPNGFVGFRISPRLSEKWTFVGRADIGAGDADLTWTGAAGFEYRFKSWGSLAFGFKALGIDVTRDGEIVHEYDVTHYGPVVGFRRHWGRR